MVEIKISVSERTNKIIQDISDDLGIKRAEFVKNVVISKLKKLRFKNE